MFEVNKITSLTSTSWVKSVDKTENVKLGVQKSVYKCKERFMSIKETNF